MQLYADYAMPVEALRRELERVVRGSKLWDGKVCQLDVTGTTERAMELRALVSAADSGRVWDLRCLVRERLIAYLQSAHPEGLPRLRAELGRPEPGAAPPEGIAPASAKG